MHEDVLPQGLGVLEHVELPLFEVVSQLKDGGPLARTDIDDLA